MTKRKKPHRTPRLPKFKPLVELQPGDPVNPYRLFRSYTVHQTILAHPKLPAGAKLVLLILCDQVYGSGFDKHKHANLAPMVGLSVRQLERHLKRLRKLKLVHVEQELGRQNFHWLLWHPLFASCSPLPLDTSDGPPQTQMSEGVRRRGRTHRNSSEELNYYRQGDFNQSTFPSGAVVPNGQTKGEDSWPAGSLPDGADNGETVNLTLDPQAAKNFRYLPQSAKRAITIEAENLNQEIQHYRQYVNDPDHSIAHQARHEIERRLHQLGELGFIVPAHNERKL